MQEERREGKRRVYIRPGEEEQKRGAEDGKGEQRREEEERNREGE